MSPAGSRLRYLGLENIESRTGRILNWGSDDKTQAGISTTFSFDASHVLYGKLRPYLNKVALPESEGRCSTEIIPLVPSEGIDREFLAYLLRLDAITAAAMKGVTGARMPRANMRELLAVSVPVPPIGEQQRITRVLRGKFADLNRARSALTDQLEAAGKLSAATLHDVFCCDAAEAWPERQLGDVIVLRNEIIHPRDMPKGEILFVGMEHVESNTGQRIGSVPIDLAKLTGRKARFYPGDLVYGYLRPYLNKLWLADRDGCCSVDQYVFTVRADLAETEFVAHFMRSDAYLKTAPVGLTPGQLPRIRTDEMAAVPMRLPDLETQRTIVRELNESLDLARALRASISDQLAALDRYPAALLRDAFAGRL